jgi:hypothetical protein
MEMWTQTLRKTPNLNDLTQSNFFNFPNLNISWKNIILKHMRHSELWHDSTASTHNRQWTVRGNTLIIPPSCSMKFNINVLRCSAYFQEGTSVLVPPRSDQLNSISKSLLEITMMTLHTICLTQPHMWKSSGNRSGTGDGQVSQPPLQIHFFLNVWRYP